MDSIDTTFSLNNFLFQEDWYKNPFYPSLTPQQKIYLQKNS